MPRWRRSHRSRALLEAFAAMAAADIDLATRLRQSAARAAAETGEAAAVERALELLLPLAERCGGDPARFLDAVALASDADFWDERAEGVALLTLHAAKGLEFACVFIVGLEDGVLPLHWGKAEDVAAEELAEERRLFYVGMTRAKDRLVLSRALKRLWRGRVHAQAPSPFLADIESELVKEQRSELRRRARGSPAQAAVERLNHFSPLIPAQAGIQANGAKNWVPAFAGGRAQSYRDYPDCRAAHATRMTILPKCAPEAMCW